ncbi:uncharacterized protein [Clytia hemisphaerica]|uniref:uncharacterized protein isoform X2 n=1 Tax=Clytia hemisphaerica TaxID=252671 RepID=UPI0034D659F4
MAVAANFYDTGVVYGDQKQPGNEEIDYDFELDGQKVDEYYCLICFLLLRDIAQMPCKHMLCKHCLDDWGKYIAELSCPKCKERFHPNQVTSNEPLDKIIKNSLRVKCKSADECSWIGTISEYIEVHSKRCHFLELKCIFVGCNKKLKRVSLSSHQTDCQHRPDCSYCNQLLLKTPLKDHYAICPKYPVDCPNGCCIVLQQSQVEYHTQHECNNRVVPCGFVRIGCREEMKQSDLLSHFDTNIHSHMKLMFIEMDQMKKKFESDLKSTTQKVEKLQNSEDLLNATIKTLQTELSTTKTKLATAEKNIEELSSKGAATYQPVQLQAQPVQQNVQQNIPQQHQQHQQQKNTQVKMSAPATPTPASQSIPVDSDEKLKQNKANAEFAAKVAAQVAARQVVKKKKKDASVIEEVDDDDLAEWITQDNAERIQYDRDFLLKFQFNPICTSKPANLPNIDIVLDTAHQPTKPLVPGQRFTNNDFMPNFMRQSIKDSSSKSDRRGPPSMGGKPLKIIQLPQLEKLELKRSENAWVLPSDQDKDLPGQRSKLNSGIGQTNQAVDRRDDKRNTDLSPPANDKDKTRAKTKSIFFDEVDEFAGVLFVRQVGKKNKKSVHWLELVNEEATAKRIQYDRDFLLKFRYIPFCISKPANLPNIDVVLDTAHQPTKPLAPCQSEDHASIKMKGKKERGLEIENKADAPIQGAFQPRPQHVPDSNQMMQAGTAPVRGGLYNFPNNGMQIRGGYPNGPRMQYQNQQYVQMQQQDVMHQQDKPIRGSYQPRPQYVSDSNQMMQAGTAPVRGGLYNFPNNGMQIRGGYPNGPRMQYQNQQYVQMQQQDVMHQQGYIQKYNQNAYGSSPNYHTQQFQQVYRPQQPGYPPAPQVYVLQQGGTPFQPQVQLQAQQMQQNAQQYIPQQHQQHQQQQRNVYQTIQPQQAHHSTIQQTQSHQTPESVPKKRTIKIVDPNSGKDLVSELQSRKKTETE